MTPALKKCPGVNQWEKFQTGPTLPHTCHCGKISKENLQRRITAENVQKIKSSRSLGGNVNGEVTKENSTEVP